MSKRETCICGQLMDNHEEYCTPFKNTPPPESRAEGEERQCEHEGGCYKKTLSSSNIPWGHCKNFPGVNDEVSLKREREATLKSFGYHKDHISKSQLIGEIEKMRKNYQEIKIGDKASKIDWYNAYNQALNDIIKIIKGENNENK